MTKTAAALAAVLMLAAAGCSGPEKGQCAAVEAGPVKTVDGQTYQMTCTCFDGTAWNADCPKPVEVIPF